MGMRNLYQRIDKILNEIKWNEIWEGFHRYPYALYNEETVWLESEEISYTHEFLGNTSIAWNGGYLAIWFVSLDEKEDAEELAAGIVHEMFHAFQLEAGEMRYPNNLEILNYPINAENFTIKYMENILLAKAYMTNKVQQKSKLLSQFAFLRKKREQLYGNAIYNEYLTETLEGMAEYAGLSALKQINEDKFRIKINYYINCLKEKSEAMFDIRKISYYSGVVLMLTISDSDINILHKIGKTQETVFQLFVSKIEVKAGVFRTKDTVITKLINQHLVTVKTTFQDFFIIPREKVIINGYICGYDPMNMIKYGQQLFCSRFIIIFNEDTQESLYIKGPVIVEIKEDTNRVLSCYYK